MIQGQHAPLRYALAPGYHLSAPPVLHLAASVLHLAAFGRGEMPCLIAFSMSGCKSMFGTAALSLERSGVEFERGGECLRFDVQAHAQTEAKSLLQSPIAPQGLTGASAEGRRDK